MALAVLLVRPRDPAQMDYVGGEIVEHLPGPALVWVPSNMFESVRTLVQRLNEKSRVEAVEVNVENADFRRKVSSRVSQGGKGFQSLIIIAEAKQLPVRELAMLCMVQLNARARRRLNSFDTYDLGVAVLHPVRSLHGLEWEIVMYNPTNIAAV